MEGEAKGGKEDAAMLNGFFKGGVEGEAYVYLVVGVWLRESVFVMCWDFGSIHKIKFQESFGSSIMWSS